MELEEQRMKHGMINEDTYAERFKANGLERYRLMKEIIRNRYENVTCDDERMIITIRCADTCSARVDCSNMEIEAVSDGLKDTLSSILQHVEDAISPTKLK